ncbi:hypothetical protein NOMA109596_06870 [Nocardioides marinus]|uniref:Uncharacterized protein n=1 Tax=Nocardioides marinus TaxID=374514 RepID=A0A7Z0C498_9ACTN|nr:hypothetical protein [Nocardioides marinus]NYI09866.1 hypothetical protein [Nocardioides marinus]
MVKATMVEVKKYLSVPGKAVSTQEIRELSQEERDELALLVGAELDGGAEAAAAA